MTLTTSELRAGRFSGSFWVDPEYSQETVTIGAKKGGKKGEHSQTCHPTYPGQLTKASWSSLEPQEEHSSAYNLILVQRPTVDCYRT